MNNYNDNNTTNTSIGAVSSILEKHIHEANIMLAYLARIGKPIDPEVSITIAETIRLPVSEINAQQESKFWSGFEKLSEAASPATIETILVNCDITETNNTEVLNKRLEVPRVIRKYTTYAIVTIIISLLLQVYWLFTNNFINQINQIKISAVNIDKNLIEIDKELEFLALQKGKYLKNLSNSNADNPVVAEIDKKINYLAYNKKSVLKNEKRDLKETYNALFSALKHPLNITTLHELFGSSDNKALNTDTLFMELQIIVNSTIVGYILPLLLGLLGANVYVLRLISIEIKSQIFLPDNSINYRLRLFLGAIAGVTFSWLFAFIVPSGGNGYIGNASPLAIAFLIGYSVEILFHGLDKLTGSIVNA